jgi:hypothetical protein
LDVHRIAALTPIKLPERIPKLLKICRKLRGINVCNCSTSKSASDAATTLGWIGQPLRRAMRDYE